MRCNTFPHGECHFTAELYAARHAGRAFMGSQANEDLWFDTLPLVYPWSSLSFNPVRAAIETPGYMLLAGLDSRVRAWHTLGGALVLLSLTRLTILHFYSPHPQSIPLQCLAWEQQHASNIALAKEKRQYSRTISCLDSTDRVVDVNFPSHCICLIHVLLIAVPGLECQIVSKGAAVRILNTHSSYSEEAFNVLPREFEYRVSQG